MPVGYIKVVHPEDNVATVLRDIEEGETLSIEVGNENRTITIPADIPFGHKIALDDVEEGRTIRKYGTSIGYATESIDIGDWVHVHNVDSNYGRGDLSEDTEAAAVHE